MLLVAAPPRGYDSHGSGAYGARRGKRLHKGVDFAVWPGSVILSGVCGEVSKIGFPYPLEHPTKGHLRYVEILTSKKYRVRYFYVKPSVTVGQMVTEKQPLGLAQNLMQVYDKKMTNHIHIEVVNPAGDHISPEGFFDGR